MEMQLTQNIYETRLLLTSLQYAQWKRILFTAQWWSLLFLLIISWLAWWKLIEKRRVFEVLAYALVVVIIGSILDLYGYKLGLWSYPIKSFYLNPGLIAGDWGLPPVVKSLVYQYYPQWKKFIIAQIVAAAFFSFIGEPILVWMGAYKMYEWSYWQSFLVYIPVAIFAKWVIGVLKRKTISSPGQ
jgi:hypothetical protein